MDAMMHPLENKSICQSRNALASEQTPSDMKNQNLGEPQGYMD